MPILIGGRISNRHMILVLNILLSSWVFARCANECRRFLNFLQFMLLYMSILAKQKRACYIELINNKSLNTIAYSLFT